MENSHEQTSSSDDDEIEEIIVLSDEDDLLSKSSSPASMMMPCTSRADVHLDQVRARTYNDSDDVPGSSDGASYTTDGEYGDAEEDAPSENQQKGLTVTFRSEANNEDLATARLTLKRQDAIDEFLTFVEALIRSMQSEEEKKTLMNEISDILIIAKTEEMHRYRRTRLP